MYNFAIAKNTKVTVRKVASQGAIQLNLGTMEYDEAIDTGVGLAQSATERAVSKAVEKMDLQGDVQDAIQRSASKMLGQQIATKAAEMAKAAASAVAVTGDPKYTAPVRSSAGTSGNVHTMANPNANLKRRKERDPDNGDRHSPVQKVDDLSGDAIDDM